MENSTLEFQQYYPTYKYQDRDVVLKEFEEAQRIASTQSRLYDQLANIFLAFITISIASLFKSSDIANLTASKENLFIFYIFIISIALVILTHFIELHKTIVINSRKVITLRRILGIDYGSLQLTLPNWRIEGASNPFVIKVFPGWISFGSSPFWLILLSINIIWFLTYKYIECSIIDTYWYLINVALIILTSLFYRYKCNELHETLFLHFIKFISRLLCVKLVDDFEYVLYRLKLSYFEINRLKIEHVKLDELLVEIEDKRFYNHRGIDYKALVRAILCLSEKYRVKAGFLRNGGSTIPMQLCRTLFIEKSNKYVRKIIELLLAKWIEKQFSKKEILVFYLCAVRFERGIYGLPQALTYFWGKKKKRVTWEEAFFLVERLSNVTSSYKLARIYSLYDKLPSNLKENIDSDKFLEIYRKLERNNLIKEKK